MSCPSCQVGGRRLPALPLAYGNRRRKGRLTGSFDSGIMNMGRNLCIEHVASSALRRKSLESAGINEVDDELVERFLLANPKVLEDFVMKNIPSENIEKWLIRKISPEQNNETENDKSRRLSRWKFCVHKDKRSMLEKLTDMTVRQEDEISILQGFAVDMAKTVKASSWNFYFLDQSEKFLIRHSSTSEDTQACERRKIEGDQTIATYVARTHETVFTKEIIGDDRFPAGTGNQVYDQSVICHPILQENKENLYGVIEFIRDAKSGIFQEEDFEIVSSYMSWLSILVHYSQISRKVYQNNKIRTFALNASRLLLESEVKADEKVHQMLEVCKDICECEYFTKFDRDKKSNELIITSTNLTNKETPESRIDWEKGVAGHVISTRNCINIKDAYNDHRFLREFDRFFDITTKTVLACPVPEDNKTKSPISSIIQLSNKTRGAFNENDVRILEICVVYIALAHTQKKKYDLMRKKEHEVMMLHELVEYHSSPRDEDLQHLLHIEDITPPEDFDRYCFNHYEETHLFGKLFVKMAREVLANAGVRYNDGTIATFTAIVKQYYRPQPYHNWVHAFSVAHFMYLMLTANETSFTPLEKAALFFACICHDVDHRGRNNAFVQHSKSPLAVLYADGSCLECHHYYLTQRILESKGCNIFESLDSEQRAQVDDVIKGAILATDLLRYFGYRGELQKIINEKAFDWNKKRHRDLTSFLMMTLSDLCGSCKPWEIHCVSVAKVFEEFYAQADEEIEMGVDPIPMFVNKEDLPLNQIGFLNAVVMPCANSLVPILPSLNIVEDYVRDSVTRWESIIKAREEDKDQLLRHGTPVEEKLEQLKLPGSKLQENSLSFVKYSLKK